MKDGVAEVVLGEDMANKSPELKTVIASLLRSTVLCVHSNRGVSELLNVSSEFGLKLNIYYLRREVYERLVGGSEGLHATGTCA